MVELSFLASGFGAQYLRCRSLQIQRATRSLRIRRAMPPDSAHNASGFRAQGGASDEGLSGS
eukprot:98406-Alexandrium_andersonii.AAC.1